MKSLTATWERLAVRILEPDESGAAVLNAVFCHGYGAPGTDLVPLGQMLTELEPRLTQRVRFIFPEAPHDLAELGMYGGRAWWNLDIFQLQQAVTSGQYRDLVNESPTELPETREQFQKLLTECAAATGLSSGRTILGGFSQGAMLSLDACLHLEERPAGLVFWSGSYINQQVWRERMARMSGLPVYQSHGRYDPILPFDLAVQLREDLTNSGNSVQFLEFAGQHEIPLLALKQTAEFLRKLSDA